MICFENLSLKFDSKTLLDNQTRNILKGQFVGLLGANGLGKSTLLRTLAGIVKPAAGKIFIYQKLLSQYSAFDLSDIRRFISADPSCAWSLRVGDIMDYSVDSDVFDFLNIRELWNKSFLVLSSGEKARVMLAAQLLPNIKILFLDELLSHLDESYQVKILNFLRYFTNVLDGVVILSLHQKNLAYEYCHQIWEIQNKVLKVYYKPRVLRGVRNLSASSLSGPAQF